MSARPVRGRRLLAEVMLCALLACATAGGCGPTAAGEAQLARPLGCPPAVDLTRPLTLADALDLGLCNNPQISAAWAAIKIQQAAVGEARAAYWPNASMSLSQARTRTVYPGAPNADSETSGHTVNLGASWRIFDFGSRRANQEAAERSLDAALASHDAALQKVMSDVAGAFLDAQAAQASVAARVASATLAEQTWRSAERRERKGVAAQSDTLQAAAALAKARLAASRARVDAQRARAELLYALGIAPSTLLRLADTPAQEGRESIESLQHWLDEAGRVHPAILSARAQWLAAQAKTAATRAEGLPSVDATANFYQNGYPNQGLQPVRSDVTTVGLTLTIPLFEGFARTYKTRGAQALAQQKEAQLTDTQHQVLTEVIRIHAAAAAAAENLEASEHLLDVAQAALASSERRYDRGVADITELLSTQAALADARQEHVRSVSDGIASRLRLAAAAGVLSRDMVDAR